MGGGDESRNNFQPSLKKARPHSISHDEVIEQPEKGIKINEETTFEVKPSPVAYLVGHWAMPPLAKKLSNFNPFFKKFLVKIVKIFWLAPLAKLCFTKTNAIRPISAYFGT